MFLQITTTPSLFAIDEIKQGESECDVDIIAKLPNATQPVEHIEIRNDVRIKIYFVRVTNYTLWFYCSANIGYYTKTLTLFHTYNFIT